jgi:hypothetical protein
MAAVSPPMPAPANTMSSLREGIAVLSYGVVGKLYSFNEDTSRELGGDYLYTRNTYYSDLLQLQGVREITNNSKCL